MADKTWKYAERKIARLFGTEREGPTGEADFVTELLAGEVKHRKNLPKWLKEAMAQAEGHAEGGRIPVLILHEKYQEYADSLAILKLKTFLDLLDNL